LPKFAGSRKSSSISGTPCSAIEVVATGRGSEAPTELAETEVFWFRDGMIVRLQGFATKEQALEAARASERDAHADS
jgi:hypothetical protein